jgi:hypothetical protein
LIVNFIIFISNKYLTLASCIMKYFVILITLFALYNSQSPNKTKTQPKKVDPSYLIFPYNDSLIDWKNVEKQNEALKEEFIKNHPSNFDNCYNGYMHPGTDTPPEPNKLKKAIHIIDINGDGLDDIIYDGSGGWETNRVLIYLNSPNGLNLIFVDKQYVKKLEFRNGHVWRIYTYDPGCCAEYMVFNKIFEFSYTGYPNDFKEIYSTAYYKHTQLSKSYLDPPINFSVLVNSCKLRTNPVVAPHDTLNMDGDMHIGNDVGIIEKGSIGRAIAIQHDNKGNEWWLVEMDLKAKIKSKILYNELSESDLSGKVGWLNSKEVKTIN